MTNNKKHILIIGASSEIGYAAYTHLSNIGFRCSGTSRNKNKSSIFRTFDLLDDIKTNVNLRDYTHCLFCAGQTSISKYEEYPLESNFLNIDRTIDFLNKAVEAKIRIIFLSSVAVFPGEKPFYSIKEPPNPTTKYGEAKLLIEKHITDNYSDSCSIIRLTKVISEVTPFIFNWKKSAEEKKSIEAFNDKYISPLSISTLVKVIEYMVTNDAFGLFHLGGKDNLTYFEYCKKIFSNEKNFVKLIVAKYSNWDYPHASLKTYLPKYISY